MIRAGNTNDSYFEPTDGDIRDRQEFKEFKAQVLAFIKSEKVVNWRKLNEKFYYQSYWLTLAVEELDGKFITVESHKIPERIVAK